MAITLKQVAKAAGVSHTTVSLVINNIDGTRVSPKTRERVLRAIRKLNYNPNLTAKRLASGKTNSIGLYTPFETPIFRNYTFIELVTGIQDVLYERGFDIVLFAGGRHLYRNRPINQIVRQSTVDGLIIFNTRYTTQRYVNNYIRNLNELTFNYVVLNYYWGKEKINYVGVDYEHDAFAAVRHLTDLGHRNIAMLAGPARATVTARIIKGYKRALQACHIDVDAVHIEYADYDNQKAYYKTQQVLKKDPSITSFFVGGYEMAPACLRGVKELGLRVPEDVSIVCFVDNEIMPLLDPPLTAIRWPYYEMGKKAAELVLSNFQEKVGFLFETELAVRCSTAQCKQRL